MKFKLEDLIGKYDDFELYHRILNAFSIIGIIFTIISIIVNYLQELDSLIFWFNSANLLIFVSLFIYSIWAKRFKSFYRLSFLHLLIIYFPGMWIINGGSYGGSQYFYYFIFILITIIPQNKDKIYFLILFIVSIILMNTIEYLYPEIIINYSSRTIRYIDVTISIVLAFLSVYVLLFTLNKLYKESLDKFEKQNKELYKKTKLISDQKVKLQKLNEDKNQFMSILGHDLRNPFNALLGFSELLKDNIEDYNKEEITRISGMINTVSHNTYNMLEDLLLWSKSLSGKMPFDPQNFLLKEIFNETVTELNYLAEHKNIEIKYKELSETTVYADKNMLRVVFRNLITNGIKFSHRNSKITISIKDLDDSILIAFCDRGVGIKEDDIQKLWDVSNPYTTLGTENEKGTGLGLFLCKEFIERHKGKIWVESEIGKGCKFKVSLLKLDNN